jgi:hypothetical protein
MMAATTDEAQSLKGMLRKPGEPVSIEEMNQASMQEGLSTDGYAYLNLGHHLCAWNAYRGALISPPQESGFLSVWFASLLENQTHLRRELDLDRLRLQYYPDQVSRLTGVFCFQEYESAKAAECWGGHFQPANLVELHLGETRGTEHRHDANWISHPVGDIEEWGRQYWNGTPHPNHPPIWETLVEGRALVLGTSVRSRAYRSISLNFIGSLALLEIARLAAWIGSDLGNVAAFLLNDLGETSVTYFINMRDAGNSQFLDSLQRLLNSAHPTNWKDLHASLQKGNLGETPDLRPYSFTL